ncbi:MAG: hypothetical protein GY715_13885 [Planctomycetes bacterium]|nr:hypothetical protein [Planctomycetota bacterium]
MLFVRIVLAGLLAYAASVQFNDPDTVRWALLYGIAAVVALLSAWSRLPRLVPIAVGVVALVWAAVLAPSALSDVDWSRWIDSEEMRELGGLLIVAVSMGIVAAFPKRRSTHRASKGDDA